eukprot:ctg_1073.g448
MVHPRPIFRNLPSRAIRSPCETPLPARIAKGNDTRAAASVRKHVKRLWAVSHTRPFHRLETEFPGAPRAPHPSPRRLRRLTTGGTHHGEADTRREQAPGPVCGDGAGHADRPAADYESIFPRGTGIVTRRPTVVQLYCTAKEKQRSVFSAVNGQGDRKGGNRELVYDEVPPEDEDDVKNAAAGGGGAPVDTSAIPEDAAGEAFAEFLHKPGVRFYNFDDVRSEIERETDRVTGKNKGISPKAINLRVYSPHVVNLTVVDLPGLTKVPVGDQPSDIERLIRAMVLSYIERPNAIILAVHPATNDLATSDALQIARIADPEGKRTVGVITKLDLMDKGTDAVEMLKGKEQIDSAGARGRDPLLQVAPVVPAHDEPVGHADAGAFAIDDADDAHSRHVAGHAAEDGQPVGRVAWRAERAGAGVRGRRRSGRRAAAYHQPVFVGVCQVAGGHLTADGEHAGAIRMDAFEGLTREDIRTAIRNATGHRNPLFVPELAFELLVKKQITRFIPPAYSCVDLVFDELVRLSLECEAELLNRYENLRQEILAAAQTLLRELKQPSMEMVQNLIAMETSYISVNHKDFIGGSAAISRMIRARMDAEQQQSGGKKKDGAQADDSQTSVRLGQGPQAPLQPQKRGQDKDDKNDDDSKSEGRFRFMRRSPKDKEGANDKEGADKSRGAGKRSDATMDNFFNEDGEPIPLDEQEEETHRKQQHSLESIPEHLKVSDVVGDRDKDDIELIRTLLASYFDVVRVNMMDLVPKAIMCFLVVRARDRMQSRLVSELYKPERFDGGAAAARDAGDQRGARYPRERRAPAGRRARVGRRWIRAVAVVRWVRGSRPAPETPAAASRHRISARCAAAPLALHAETARAQRVGVPGAD